MLGHRSIQTTTRYVRVSEDQARQAMMRLDEAV
jgi:integrase